MQLGVDKKKVVWNKKEFSNVIWQLGDKILTFFSGMVLMVLLANHYGAAQYGEYQYIISIIAIYELILNFIDTRVVLKRYDVIKPDKMVYNVFILKVLLSILLAFVVIITMPFLEMSQRAVWMLVILACNSAVIAFRFGPTVAFLHDLKVKNTVIACDIGIIISFIWQLYAIYYDRSLLYISFTTLISNLIVTVIIYVEFISQYKWSKEAYCVDIKYLKEVLRESFPLVIATAVYIIYTRTDSLMIGKLLSVEMVAIYSIAVKLISVIELGIIPIQNTAYIKMIELYKKNEKEYEDYYIKMSSIMTWMVIIGGFISIKILPFVLELFNKEYAVALEIYNILIWSMLFAYNGMLRAGHITLVEKGSILTISNVITVILNVLLNYIFICWMGMKGAAIATVLVKFFCIEGVNIFFREGRKILLWQLKAFNPIYIVKKC